VRASFGVAGAEVAGNRAVGAVHFRTLARTDASMSPRDDLINSLPRSRRPAQGLEFRVGLVLWLALGSLILILSAI
jgi:hypothetical protein